MNQIWNSGTPNKTDMQKLSSRLYLTTALLLAVALLSEMATGFGQRAPRQAASKQSAQRQSKQAIPKEISSSLAPPLRLSKKILANGLEVVVFEDHSVPLATVEMAVKNGSYTEPPELNGLSHLYEHMFFKTNRATASRASYLLQLDQQGISYNGTTREEIVEYYFTSTSQNLRTALNLMRDAIRYPLFEKGEFERERRVVISEIDRNESNPFYYLNKEMNDRLFYKYPSRKNPLGSRETVSSATTDQMRLIQGRYYAPNNSALIVTGDAIPEAVFQMAQEYYGDWEKAEDPFVKFPIVKHPPLPKSEGIVIKQPVQNVIIEIGWHGPSIGEDNAATYAADLFSFIMRQPNSRFQRNLIDTGLATGIGIGYYTQRNVGPITILVQTTPDKARATLKAVYEEVAHFTDPDYYTDDQLESAKALLEADDLFSREKPSEYAHNLGFWWASTGLDYFSGYLAQLRRTSRGDISRYIKTYIQGQPHVGIALMSEDAANKINLTPVDLIGE